VPPGAQRERTALAWRRTALAFAGNGILLARSPDTWIVIGSFAVLALAAALAATSSRGGGGGGGGPAGLPPPPPPTAGLRIANAATSGSSP